MLTESHGGQVRTCDLYWEHMGIMINWTAVTEKGRMFLQGACYRSVDLANHAGLMKEAADADMVVVEFNPWETLKGS